MLIELTAGLSNEWMESYGVFRDEPCLFNKGIIKAMTTFYKLQEYPDGDLHNMICGLLLWDQKKRFTTRQARSLMDDEKLGNEQ